MPRQSVSTSSVREDEAVPLEVVRTRRLASSPPVKNSEKFSEDDSLTIQSETVSQHINTPSTTNELKRGLKARHVGESSSRSVRIVMG
jgi:hypothetical protein